MYGKHPKLPIGLERLGPILPNLGHALNSHFTVSAISPSMLSLYDDSAKRLKVSTTLELKKAKLQSKNISLSKHMVVERVRKYERIVTPFGMVWVRAGSAKIPLHGLEHEFRFPAVTTQQC